MMKKKLYFCEECGFTFFQKRRPKECGLCENKKIGRALTEDDLQ